MQEYYLNPPGTESKNGPLTEEELKSGLATGSYAPQSLVWCEGMPEWKPLGQLFPESMPPKLPTCPPTHLTLAAILTVMNFLLFFPFCIPGIIAIVKACKVEELWRAGHAEEAERVSRTVHTLNMWSLGLLLLPFLLFTLLFFSIVCALLVGTAAITALP